MDEMDAVGDLRSEQQRVRRDELDGEERQNLLEVFQISTLGDPTCSST